MAETSGAGAGVRDLISRIRDEGVQAGKSEAERVVSEARAEAATILAEAKAQAEALRAEVGAEVASQRAAALESLRLAARDTVLEMQASIARDLEQHIRRLVSSATRDEELIKHLVLVLAGRAAEEFIGDKQAVIEISDALFGPGEPTDDLRDRERDLILALTNEMLREGIDLMPTEAFRGGARVRLVGEEVEIDLSDEAISNLLFGRLLPRFRDIARGNE